jgi:segregation and condensation protein A
VEAPSLFNLDLDLDLFNGPFDLLLTLVLRDEVDLVEVPIAAICVEYLTRIAETGLDLEAASEFLVLVAALCELKSRLLLPDEQVDGPETPLEAADELAARLAEYARIRAAAAWLAGRVGATPRRVFRTGPPAAAPPRPVTQPLHHEDPARLAAAAAALLTPPEPVDVSHLPKRLLPVTMFLERFRSVLAETGTFLFDDAVRDLDRISVAVAFWALLEMYKQGEVRLAQQEPFAPIRVARATGLLRTRETDPAGEEAVA